MIITLARFFLLALAAVIALTSAPAMAQSTTNIALSCIWKGVVYDVVPDNGKPPGAFRVEAAKCGAENAWQLPLPGGVTASFKTAADVTAYLKESHRLHESALKASDPVITANKKEIADLKALLAKTRAGDLQKELAAAQADTVKAHNERDGAIKERDDLAAKLKAALTVIDTMKTPAPKPADS